MDATPEPEIRDIDAALTDHIAVEFGQHGARAVAFLQSAHDLLTSDLEVPSKGELIAYSIREALKSLLESQAPAVRRQTSDVPSWSKLSRRVAAAHAAWEAVSHDTAESADALKDLSVSIREMAELHETEDLNRRRLIAVLIDRTGSTPYGTGAELIEEYATLVQAANKSLHGAVSVEVVADYWSRTVALLEILFMPRAARNQQLEALASITDPTETDLAELRRLVVVPGHFGTFLNLLDSSAWLPLLATSGLLDPPTTQTWWPGHVVLGRLKDSHLAEVLVLLETLYSRAARQPQAVYSIAWGAHDLGQIGKPLLIECLARAPELVAHLAIDQLRIGEPADHYVEEVARRVLTADVLAAEQYLDPLLEALLAGVTEDNARNRIAIVVRAIAGLEREDDSAWFMLKYERGISVGQVRPAHSREQPEKLLNILTGLLEKSVPKVGFPNLVALLEPLSAELRDRLLPWMLSLPATEVDDGVLLGEIERGVGSRFATVDDIALIERAVDVVGQDLVTGHATAAFGPPPTDAELAPRRGTLDWPDEWRFRFTWSPLFPAAATVGWADTLSAMTDRLGPATRARIERRMMGEMVSARSPIPIDRLAGLERDELLNTVREWRPGPQDWLNSANELAEAMVGIMRTDLHAWTADPVAVARELVHPTYITRYLWMLSQDVGDYELDAALILDLVNLVFDAPWEVEVIGGEARWDYEDTWGSANSAALELLKQLFQRDVDLGDGVEALLQRLMAFALTADPEYEPSDSEPFDRALNHRPTVAFMTVLAAAAWDYRVHGATRAVLIGFFTDCVNLPGPTGDEMRAVLAVELPLVGTLTPEWLDSHFDCLFSTEDDRGQQTLEASLKWGRPATRILESFPARIWDAVGRDVERALEKVLYGMFWHTTGYGVSDVVRRLKTMNRLSEAGEAVGHLLQRSTDIPAETIETALAFWDAALDARSDEPLTGFGWYATVDEIDVEALAQRLARTLRATEEPLKASYQIAKRLGESDQTEITLTVLDLMVRRQSHSFDQRMVAATAATALKVAQHLGDTPAYQRLKNAVDERKMP